MKLIVVEISCGGEQKEIPRRIPRRIPKGNLVDDPEWDSDSKFPNEIFFQIDGQSAIGLAVQMRLVCVYAT